MYTIKIRGIPVQVVELSNKYELRYNFSREVNESIKSTFTSCVFDKDAKRWRIAKSNHNELQLAWYRGEDPFGKYNEPPQHFPLSRDLYEHQKELVNAILSYRSIIGAYEMGTGKSLAFIESAERSNYNNIWYVGPKSGISAVKRELIKWDAGFTPTMMTYEGMTKNVKEGNHQIPEYVFFDECSKLKTPTSQRSVAALKLVTQMRNNNPDSITFLGTGTPSPKDPSDWFSQCKIACEGFIKEPDIKKFADRMSVSMLQEVYKEKIDRVIKFNKRLFWLDNEAKCKKCGKLEDEHTDHKFIKSTNEVLKLHNRLKGLVHIKFKKDCLDLPDKIYQVVELTPTKQMLQDIKMIRSIEDKAPQLASKMMQISDGFLYTEKVLGTKPCALCGGSGQEYDPLTKGTGICIRCEGKGEEDLIERVPKYAHTPKDEELLNILEAHEEVGRLIIWGGFTATIDKITEMVLKQGWNVIQVDGRGHKAFPSELNPEDLLIAMDKSHKDYDKLEKVCFVGNADAGGMALTLTASPTEVFYSNSHRGESRMQAEDRFHRAGMDVNVKPVIIDLLCLPIDRLVLKRLKEKKDLQSLTLGELEALN